MKITFTVPGQPIAKARTRNVPFKRCRKCGAKTVRRVCLCGNEDFEFLTSIEMSDKDTVRYENLVAAFARAAMQETGLTSLLVGPLSLSARLYFPLPNSQLIKLIQASKKEVKAEELVANKEEKKAEKLKKAAEKLRHSVHAEGSPRSQRPDASNCLKSVEDGLNKVLYGDDSQLWRVTVEKMWSQMPRAEIEIETC